MTEQMKEHLLKVGKGCNEYEILPKPSEMLMMGVEHFIRKLWHDASEEPKPNMELICIGQYGNPLVLSSNSDSFKSRDISKWAYFNDLLNLSNVQRTAKNSQEPISEDLGGYINELSKQFPEVSFAKLSRIVVRVAKWQKEQMMAKAVEVTVHIDTGNYPYIPQMELYDYDNDVPLAKEGDNYKVILIKEG